MKKIKRYTEFIKENSTEWKEITLDIPLEDFFGRFFTDKVKIDEDEKHITYSYHNKQWDEDEKEYFWEKKIFIKVDKTTPEITHYWEQILIDRPLYKVREEGMTREQELTIRSWCGTSRKPKSGTFEGYDKGLAKFKSGHSDKLYHVLPNGDIVEMLNDDKIDKEYIDSIIDYLLDTRNLDLIDVVKNQLKK